MICQKPLQIAVSPALPSAQAWWTMELGVPTSLTDSVIPITLVSIAGGGFMTFVPGKIAQGYQQAASLGQSVVTIRTSVG